VFQSLRVDIDGGDEREAEIARLAAQAGAAVKAYGFPWPEAGVPGAERAQSALDAVKGARYILLPVPLGVGLALYAPAAAEPVIADEEFFAQAEADAHAFAGLATPEVRTAAESAGVHVHDYDSDRELMLLRGPAIVEGALQQAIEATDVTIHGAQVVVVGFGNIGQLLARTLKAIGACVHVAARNPVQRAAARADGLLPLTLDELAELAPSIDMVFSTVPAQVVDRAALERLPKDSLVLDLAPPPHHADLDLAAALGLRAVWARGMGKRAPVTVGASQWSGLSRYITEIEDARREGREWTR
jgi:dipicolinate synthase subunit A